MTTSSSDEQLTDEQLTLLPATEEDRTYIARLNYLTDVYGDESKEIEEDKGEGFNYYVSTWRPEGGGIIAWRGHIPAGGVWLNWGTDEDHGYGHLREGIPELAIAVENRFSGQGIATTLLDAAAELAQAKGAPGISLAVAPDNERAHRLYLHVGFEETGVVRHEHPVLVRYFD